MARLKFLPPILFLLIFFAHANATDRNFAYTYESRTLQAGLRELEVWVSYNGGRDDFFSAVQNRLEFEVGLGKRLQTSFYLNLNAETASQTFYVPETDENGNLIFQQQNILQTKFNVGFSNEWKYQLSDPSANKIGSALYAEIGIGSSEYEIETKIILDKKFKRMVTALNLVGEWEWETEKEGDDFEMEFKPEIDYGLSYSLPKNFSIGVEARNSNVIHEGNWEHSALYVGPVFSYKQNDWWITLAAQPQVADLKHSGLDLEDHEKVNTRLLFSYSF